MLVTPSVAVALPASEPTVVVLAPNANAPVPIAVAAPFDVPLPVAWEAGPQAVSKAFVDAPPPAAHTNWAFAEDSGRKDVATPKNVPAASTKRARRIGIIDIVTPYKHTHTPHLLSM
jgi:hypothetical protein